MEKEDAFKESDADFNMTMYADTAEHLCFRFPRADTIISMGYGPEISHLRPKLMKTKTMTTATTMITTSGRYVGMVGRGADTKVDFNDDVND